MSNGTGGFLNPEKVLFQLGIKPGMKVADFGCGHGYFAIPLARLIKDNGFVFAIDVLPDAIEAVNSKIKLFNLSNIKTIRANVEMFGGSSLKGSSIDMVLLANILFQSKKKSDIIKEARRVLKSNGKLIIIDWKVNNLLAPKEGWLISKEQSIKLAQKQGFIFEKEFEVDKSHYGLVFIKSF